MYPREFIIKTKYRADGIGRTEFLGVQNRKQEHRIMCAFNYIPLANPIIISILKYWDILHYVPGCQRFPFVGLRRTKYIKDIIRSEFSEQETKDKIP